MQPTNINWEKLSTVLSTEAGRWRIMASACQLLVLIISALASTDILAPGSALAVSVLAILSVVLIWQSDQARRIADAIKRKFEFGNGLGWHITPKEASDLLANLSPAGRRAVPTTPEGQYFASTSEPSPKRLLENLVESSWWSKHLAHTAARSTWAVFSVVLAVAVVTLLITMNNVANQALVTNIGKVISSVIVFLFSAGYFRTAIDHGRFSTEAGKVEDRAEGLLSLPVISEAEALKLVHEYQLARAGAPPIPSWIWHVRQTILNEAWKQRRS